MSKALIILTISVVCFEVLMAQNNHNISTKNGYYGVEGLIPFQFNYIVKDSLGNYIVALGEFASENKPLLIGNTLYENESLKKTPVENCLYGLYHANGNQLLACEYNYISALTNDFYIIGKGHAELNSELKIKQGSLTLGLYNVGLKKITVKPKYSYIGNLYKNLVLVGQGTIKLYEGAADGMPESEFYMGVYNLDMGKEILKCKYDRIFRITNETILTYKGDYDGTNGLFEFVALSDGYELHNLNGERLVKNKFEYIDNRNDAFVILTELHLDKRKKIEFYGNNYDAYAEIQMFGYYGQDTTPEINLFGNNSYCQVVNYKGEEVSGKYSFIGPLNNGLALVFKGTYEGFELFIGWDSFMLDGHNGVFGYINTKGEEVIPLIYDKAESFKEGKALVEKDGREFYIDLEGKEVK